MTFLTTIYCEQRNICYSKAENDVTNSFNVVFYQNTKSTLSCGAQCSNDVCCVRFIYTKKTSKECIGVHHMENGVHSSQESTTLSNITQQYRKGNRNFRRQNIFTIRQNLRNKYCLNLFLTSTLRLKELVTVSVILFPISEST